MPAARLPKAKADLEGKTDRSPGRHKDRKEPKNAGLGNPSTHMSEDQKRAFEAYKRELPWLTEGDRSLIELACQVRGRILAGEEVGISAVSALSSILSKLGATPADRTKVSMPEDEEEPDEFFDN